jgi:hypothetical protein
MCFSDLTVILKKIECENDISLMFVAVISGLTGVEYKDKNELFLRLSIITEEIRLIKF